MLFLILVEYNFKSDRNFSHCIYIIFSSLLYQSFRQKFKSIGFLTILDFIGHKEERDERLNMIKIYNKTKRDACVISFNEKYEYLLKLVLGLDIFILLCFCLFNLFNLSIFVSN